MWFESSFANSLCNCVASNSILLQNLTGNSSCKWVLLSTQKNLKCDWLIETVSLNETNYNELMFCPTEKETLMGNEGIYYKWNMIDGILHVLKLVVYQFWNGFISIIIHVTFQELIIFYEMSCVWISKQHWQHESLVSP